MTRTVRLYRTLLWLYPSAFRHEYGSDMVTHFDDLVADLGVWPAWRRTLVDLIVTVPRYRLEDVMSHRQASITLAALTVATAATGIGFLAAGFGPASVVPLVFAVVLAVSQRSQLARALRVPGDDLRRRRLLGAMASAVIFVVAVGIYAVDLGDDHVAGGSLIAYNIVGLLSLLGAIGLTIVGLSTPRLPARNGPAPS